MFCDRHIVPEKCSVPINLIISGGNEKQGPHHFRTTSVRLKQVFSMLFMCDCVDSSGEFHKSTQTCSGS